MRQRWLLPRDALKLLPSEPKLILLLHAQPMPRPDPRQGSGRIGHSIPYGCSLQNIAEQKDCAIELQEYTKKTSLRPYSDLTWGV